MYVYTVGKLVKKKDEHSRLYARHDLGSMWQVRGWSDWEIQNIARLYRSMSCSHDHVLIEHWLHVSERLYLCSDLEELWLCYCENTLEAVRFYFSHLKFLWYTDKQPRHWFVNSYWFCGYNLIVKFFPKHPAACDTTDDFVSCSDPVLFHL